MIGNALIKEIKKRLINTYDPIAIYIFGSYAWGHPTEESDIDLLIVVSQYEKDRFKMMSNGYRALGDLNIGKDILVYSKEDFEKFSAEPTTFCHKITKEGKMIYAKSLGLA